MGEEIGFSEYALGVLWMIDLMEHELGSCFQKKLGEYLKEWWSSIHDVTPHINSHRLRAERLNSDSALSRAISDFVRADLVRSKQYSKDRRVYTLELTAKGRQFLKRLQVRRLGNLQKIGVPKEMIDRMESVAHEIADVIWKKRQAAVQEAARKKTFRAKAGEKKIKKAVNGRR